MNHKLQLILLLACGLLFKMPSPVRAEDAHHHSHEEEGHEEHHEEGIELSTQELTARGISVETAGPQTIAKTLSVNAKVSANNDKVAHLHPRFPGLLIDVRKQTGERVTKGEILAVVESNQSLQRYEIASLLDGTVLYRHATIGEFVDVANPIFVIADLSTVWVNLHIFPRDFNAIRIGQEVRLKAPHVPDRLVTARISFTSGVVDEESQARIARVVVENAQGLFLPDQYVNADVILESYPAPLAVKTSSVQRIVNDTVVFAKGGHGFTAKQVTLGRKDGEYAEVLSGLEVGEEYAAGNTFILKAELGKGSAEHEH